jgi:hypothetical protein
MDKRGTLMKQPLESSPFVLEFEYGAQGYCMYDHMVLQFEDCVDVVKVLYIMVIISFSFYHSCCHNRKIPDVLHANSIWK